MQIVIDIDDETYNDIKKGKIYSSFRDVPLESVNAIANGTPLDKIRAEIKDIAFDWQEIDGEHESFMVVDLNDVLLIIDEKVKEQTSCEKTCGNCKNFGTVNCSETYREPTKNDDVCEDFKK